MAGIYANDNIIMKAGLPALGERQNQELSFNAWLRRQEHCAGD